MMLISTARIIAFVGAGIAALFLISVIVHYFWKNKKRKE